MAGEASEPVTEAGIFEQAPDDDSEDVEAGADLADERRRLEETGNGAEGAPAKKRRRRRRRRRRGSGEAVEGETNGEADAGERDEQPEPAAVATLAVGPSSPLAAASPLAAPPPGMTAPEGGKAPRFSWWRKLIGPDDDTDD